MSMTTPYIVQNMTKKDTAFPKKKVVEVVRPDYQPTEAEKREVMRTELSFDELTKALLQETEVRHTEKPEQ